MWVKIASEQHTDSDSVNRTVPLQSDNISHWCSSKMHLCGVWCGYQCGFDLSAMEDCSYYGYKLFVTSLTILSQELLAESE